MTKSNLFWLLAIVLLTATPPTHAQQAGKIFRIGVLDPSTAAGSAVRLEAFWQEVRKLGWIEGKNITIESRFAEGKRDRLSELAEEIVRLKVDLFVATSTAAALAAKKATTTIPIVMTNAGDPVAAGLVTSLARPGGNVTGVSSLAFELSTKRLEILKDAVSKLDRVAIPLVPGFRSSVSYDIQIKDLRASAVALTLKIEEVDAQTDAQGLENFFQTAKQKRVGAILMDPSTIYVSERKRIVDLAGKYRLPAIYPWKAYVDAGGLMYYGVDATDFSRRAAVYVDKILKGAKPADLPVEQATKFEFVINLKAAKQIGHTMPLKLLERANQVIR